MSIDKTNDIARDIFKTQRQLSIASSFRTASRFQFAPFRQGKEAQPQSVKAATQKFSAKSFYQTFESKLAERDERPLSQDAEEQKNEALKARSYGFGGYDAILAVDKITSNDDFNLMRTFYGIAYNEAVQLADEHKQESKSLEQDIISARDFGYGGHVMATMQRGSGTSDAFYAA